MSEDGLKLREQLETRRAALIQERDRSWRPGAMDLRDYIEPNTGRFESDETNDGRRRDQRIFNNTAGMASGILAAGMHSGMTNPAIPWFNLESPDPDLNKYAPVQKWLYNAVQVMSSIFIRSNLYNALPTCYGEQGVFGQGVICAVPDEQSIVRFYNFTIGSYSLATSNRQVVDTIYRDFDMTPRQMVQQFGIKAVSAQVKQLYERGSESWIKVCHAIEPNDERKAGRLDNKNMPFRSVYWELSGDKKNVLRTSGFKKFPAMAPRWKTKGDSVYGVGPGSVCIGDVKELQNMELRKKQLLEKGVRPPMGAPASMRGQRLSILPGDVTYIQDSQIGAKFAPLYEVNPAWLGQLRAEIAAAEQRIDEAFYVDLFLMISRMDTVRTATEIAARKEEKMLMLGPILERQNDELLDPLIDFVFDQMLAQSIPRWQGLLPGAPLLPPPPEELAGMDLQVEYTSILAQASKALGAGSIERAIAFTGQLAQSFPEAADLLDVDAATRGYYSAIGVNPNMLRDEEVVGQIRGARAEQQQQQAKMDQLAQVAQGAKTLSETQMGGDTALNSAAEQMQGA